MTILTKNAADVFAPTDVGGIPRSISNQEVQVWGTEIEAGILSENFILGTSGAVGDGVIDDTAAFATIEAAITGGGIDLLGKAYKVSAIPNANDYYNGAFKVGSEIYRQNRRPSNHPFEDPIATVRDIDPVAYGYRGLCAPFFPGLPSGRQAICYREAPGHGNENNSAATNAFTGSYLRCRLSDDFGYNFLKPTGPGNSGPEATTIYEDDDADTRNMSYGMLGSRLGILAARVNRDGTHQDPIFAYSDDNGVTWTVNVLTGFTAAVWNFHSKIHRWPAGGSNGYIAYFYRPAGIGYVTTTDGGTTWSEVVNIVVPTVAFPNLSEMTIARVGDENKWLMVIRTGLNMVASVSTDMTTWSAITDTGVLLEGNPPELFYDAGKFWVLAFSRRGQVVISQYANAMIANGGNAKAIFAANGASGWEGWQIVTALEMFPTGYIALEKVRGRWYGLFNMENYAGSTQSTLGTLMMLSSDSLYRRPKRDPNPNLFVNGAFRQWPLGTTLTGTTRDVVVPGMTFARASSVADWTVSRTTGAFGPHGIRIQRDDGNSGTQEMIAVINLPILTSRLLFGKQVTVSFRARKASGFSAASNFLTVQLRQSKYTTEQAITNAGGVFPNDNDAVGTSSSGFTLTGGWQKFTMTPGKLGTEPNPLPGEGGRLTYLTQQVCLRIFWTPVGTALNDYIEIEELKIEEGDTATPFVYEDLAVERARCAAWVQTFDVKVAAGANTDYPFPFGAMLAVPTVTATGGLTTNNVTAGGARVANASGALVSGVATAVAVF